MAHQDWARKAEAQWPEFQAKWPVPYFPNVTVGWDNTPRYAWLANVTSSTPDEYESSLLAAKEFIDSHANGPRVLTINSWNEWTEGSYLEPDTKNGDGHLKAIRKVFGPKSKASN
jgi:hypothetical protein